MSDHISAGSKFFALLSLILSLVFLVCIGYLVVQNFTQVKQFFQNYDQFPGLGITGSKWVDLVLVLSPVLGWLLAFFGSLMVLSGNAAGIGTSLFGYILTWGLLAYYFVMGTFGGFGGGGGGGLFRM